MTREIKAGLSNEGHTFIRKGVIIYLDWPCINPRVLKNTVRLFGSQVKREAGRTTSVRKWTAKSTSGSKRIWKDPIWNSSPNSTKK
jgi:hypothetical protein